MFWLGALSNLIFLELAVLWSTWFFYVGSVITLVIILYVLITEARRYPVGRAPIMIAVIFFLIAHYLLFIFLENYLLIQFFIIACSLALGLFLFVLHDRAGENFLRLPYGIENITSYFNLASFFFGTVALYFFELNSNQKFFWFFGLFGALVISLSYSSYLIFDIQGPVSRLYLGVTVFVMLELFWVVGMMPVPVYTKAGLLVVFFYLILGLSKHYLIFGWAGFSRKIFWRYIAVAGSSVVIILSTTKW